MKKEIKKIAKKTHKSIIICILIFLIIGFASGYGVTLLVTKNDTFELIGDKNITLNVNQQYQEKGVKAISFGKDLKDEVVITSNVDTTKEGEYTVIYTIKSSLKYKNIKRVRYVSVVNGSDNNA